MPARNISAEWRKMHRIGGAQALVDRIGIADEIRRQRIKQRLGTCDLRKLVHGSIEVVVTLKRLAPLDAMASSATWLAPTTDLACRKTRLVGPTVAIRTMQLDTLLYRVAF
jgi:hypothetical protein